MVVVMVLVVVRFMFILIRHIIRMYLLLVTSVVVEPLMVSYTNMVIIMSSFRIRSVRQRFYHDWCSLTIGIVEVILGPVIVRP